MKSEIERLKEALQIAYNGLHELACLGNGDRYGNSNGNMIARGCIDQMRDTINPPPKMETIPVERWECQVCGHVHKSPEAPKICDGPSGDGWCNGKDCFFKLTGTITRPKKQPVEKSVSGKVVCNPYPDGKTRVVIEGLELPFATPVTITWTE